MVMCVGNVGLVFAERRDTACRRRAQSLASRPRWKRVAAIYKNEKSRLVSSLRAKARGGSGGGAGPSRETGSLLNILTS